MELLRSQVSAAESRLVQAQQATESTQVLYALCQPFRPHPRRRPHCSSRGLSGHRKHAEQAYMTKVDSLRMPR